MTGCQNRQ